MDLKNLIDSYKKEWDKNGMGAGISFSRLIPELEQALQLRQSQVSGSFNKCTCLHPHPSCLTGHCTICNRPIVKNITTDDLKNCH